MQSFIKKKFPMMQDTEGGSEKMEPRADMPMMEDNHQKTTTRMSAMLRRINRKHVKK